MAMTVAVAVAVAGDEARPSIAQMVDEQTVQKRLSEVDKRARYCGESIFDAIYR